MAEADDPVSIAAHAIDQLELDPGAKDALRLIHAEITAGYQRSFLEMLQVLRKQASALDRLQATLGLLVEVVAPQIKDRIPVALAVADRTQAPDLASALVVADPIGMGYTLTQANLAEAMGLSAPDVSVLARFLKLNDEDCAVVLRRGGKANQTVNYHPRAIERFTELIESANSSELNTDQRNRLRRVRKVLAIRKGPQGGGSTG